MAEIEWEWSTFNFGDEVRRRLIKVHGRGMNSSNATPRARGNQAPQPLSQYDIGSETPGYRLEHTERGHLIGLQFGGPESSYNLVPMYAGFNGGSGQWGILETRIRKWCDGGRGRRLSMLVLIGYETSDAAIPSYFSVTCHPEAGGELPNELKGFQFHVHPPAQISYDEIVDNDMVILDELKRAQKEMMLALWTVESSGQVSIAGHGRSLRSGPQNIPVAAGGVDPSKFDLTTEQGRLAFYLSRPYAVLDYLLLNKPEVYASLGFGKVGKFDNTQPFSEAQKSAVRKVNILAHLGYMVSDLWDIIPREEKYRDLYVGSADASAQVDHITGKAGSGSNCYSNARLVSKMMNLALNRTGMQAEVNAIYENKANWPGLSQLFLSFWTGL